MRIRFNKVINNFKDLSRIFKHNKIILCLIDSNNKIRIDNKYLNSRPKDRYLSNQVNNNNSLNDNNNRLKDNNLNNKVNLRVVKQIINLNIKQVKHNNQDKHKDSNKVSRVNKKKKD